MKHPNPVAPDPASADGAFIRRWLALIIVLGAAIRVYLALTASVIARDGCEYVAMARRMAVDWHAGIPPQLHFGFPFLIRWTHAAVGNALSGYVVLSWQRSGQLVSLLGGLACIFLVFALGRFLFSQRVGLIAAMIWALLPTACQLSADALSDMPYLALTLGGLLALMSGLERISMRRFFVAGLLSGGAYCLRPEGAEVALVAALLGFLTLRTAWSRRCIAAMSVVLGFAILGGTYIIVEGGHVFSKHIDIFDSSEASAFQQSTLVIAVVRGAAFAKIPRAALEIALKLIQSLHGVWLIAGIASIAIPRLRRTLSPGWRAPVTLAAIHIAILFWLFIHRDYVSTRHLMILDVFIVILAANTIAALLSELSAQLTAVAVISLLLSPWLFRDINQSRFYARVAGRWIGSQFAVKPPPRIVADHGWAPFYAGVTDWAHCAKLGDIAGTPPMASADLLIFDSRFKPPARVCIDTAGYAWVTITPLKEFTDQDGTRGLVVYRVERAAR